MTVMEAFRRGQEIRKKQDDIIELFIRNIRNIEDMDVLKQVEKGLQDND